jgi:hypothetical protein
MRRQQDEWRKEKERQRDEKNMRVALKLMIVNEVMIDQVDFRGEVKEKKLTKKPSSGS